LPHAGVHAKTFTTANMFGARGDFANSTGMGKSKTFHSLYDDQPLDSSVAANPHAAAHHRALSLIAANMDGPAIDGLTRAPRDEEPEQKSPPVKVIKPRELPPGSGIERPTGWNRLVIHPNNRVKGVFDMIIIVCVIYTSIVAVIKVSYRVEFLDTVDVALDVIFIIDILVQFFAGYFDLGGTRFPVLNLRRVVMRYLQTWFLIDLIAGVPLDRFVNALGPIGLIKVVRLLKIRRIMKKWENLSWGPLLKVLTIIAFWLLSAHWVACGFFAIGWATCRVFNDTWVTTYWPDLTDTCKAGLPASESLHLIKTMAGLPARDAVTIGTMHIRAMYWALATMSSMGYGNAPRAHSDVDYVYAMFAQVVGACLAAAIFSNIAQMINKGDASGARYQMQLDKINEFMRLYKLSPAMRSKLHGYNELLFTVNRGFDLQEIASMFPKSVQEDIFFDLHHSLVRLVPMFQSADDNFVRAIVRLLKPQVLLEGDLAFRKNEPGDTMFFIQMGRVQIGNEDFSVVFAVKRPKSFFGEYAMFTAQRRSASARALQDVILYGLHRSEFMAVCECFPYSYERMHARAMVELNKTSASNLRQEEFQQNTESPRRSSRKGSVFEIIAPQRLTSRNSSSGAPRRVSSTCGAATFLDSLPALTKLPSVSRLGSSEMGKSPNNVPSKPPLDKPRSMVQSLRQNFKPAARKSNEDGADGGTSHC